MVNSTGPRHDPCGTPVVSCFFPERVPLICTCWVLWERYDVHHFKSVPPTPKPDPKVSNKILWSIVSNAALRSSMTRRVTFWSSMFSKISDCTFRSAVSVLWNGLLADWPDGRGRTLFIWSLNWLTDAFSVSLDINGKLLTGLKLWKTSSRPSFFRRGLTWAFSTLQGSIQI